MPWKMIQERKDVDNDKTIDFAPFLIIECNVDLNSMMNTSFSDWKDAFLDTGASCHMSF